MHATKLLHNRLQQSAPEIHQTRLNSFITAVHSATNGANLTITSLGRGLQGSIRDKHKIKRVDRLIGNPHLYQDRTEIYRTLTELALSKVKTPMIVIDWSPLCGDLSHQLLRAAVPVGGRALTLYEEVHPIGKLGNRIVQHRFIDHLAAILPKDCKPIIVGDGGFRTPFYRYVENQYEWHWIGRVRGRDFIRPAEQEDNWVSVKALFLQAKQRATFLGEVDWVKNHPMQAMAVTVRHGKKNRHNMTIRGNRSRSRYNAVNAKRNSEPWVIVYSISLQAYSHHQILKLYKKRMQIELGFRDTKSIAYGLGLCQRRCVSLQRRAILCLIAACVTWLLWCIGEIAKAQSMEHLVRPNSSSKRAPYSAPFLARMLLAKKVISINQRQLLEAVEQAKRYLECEGLR